MDYERKANTILQGKVDGIRLIQDIKQTSTSAIEERTVTGMYRSTDLAQG